MFFLKRFLYSAGPFRDPYLTKFEKTLPLRQTECDFPKLHFLQILEQCGFKFMHLDLHVLTQRIDHDAVLIGCCNILLVHIPTQKRNIKLQTISLLDNNPPL